MAQKLTSSVIKTVQTMRNNGYSYSEIKAETGLSDGSIANALKGGKSKTSQARTRTGDVSEKAITPPGETLTHEDLRAYLSDQIRDLRTQCTNAEAVGDKEQYARSNRGLVTATALLGKLTPAPIQVDPDGVWVDGDTLRETATATRAKLHELLDRAIEASE